MKAHEVRLSYDAVRALARSTFHDADRKRMDPGNGVLPFSEVATGIASFSARATNSLAAPDARTPPPATMTGRSAS